MKKRKMSPSVMNQTAIFIPSAPSLVIVNLEQNLKKLTFINIYAMIIRNRSTIQHTMIQKLVESCNKYQNNG
jgi:hypothetical protein